MGGGVGWNGAGSAGSRQVECGISSRVERAATPRRAGSEELKCTRAETPPLPALPPVGGVKLFPAAPSSLQLTIQAAPGCSTGASRPTISAKGAKVPKYMPLMVETPT